MKWGMCMMVNTGILGIGVDIPDRVVNNEELGARFGMKASDIERKTGIIERRYLSKEETLTELCERAGKRAIENAGVNAEEIDLVIIATNTHDTHITAALVQDRIGARKCAGLDLHSGCSSFITGLATAVQFVKTGMYKKSLVVAVDKCSSLLNPDDYKTSLIFGDGAAAVIVGEVPEGRGILGITMQMDGSGGHHLHLDENKHIKMNGRAVFDFAVEKFPEAVNEILAQTGHTLEDVHFIIPHQSNLRIIETSIASLGYPMDQVHTHTIRYYGNSSAPTIPIGLHKEVTEGKIKDGDLVILVGYGAGLGWGAVALRWGS